MKRIARTSSGWLLLALLLALLPLAAQAQQVRAWLDRDSIALGETATLNVQVDGPGDSPPDYAPLLRDFRLSGHSSSRSYRQVNGNGSVRTLYGVALEPLREGVLPIPPLRVAGTTTPALTLTVTQAAARPAHAGDTVFVEAEVDDRSPWVQQAMGYVVRLYSAVPLVSGQLDQPEPDGATLQRIGEDLRYTRAIDGRQYTVIERHFLLVPERSGKLVVPGARFSGQGIGGFFGDFFGNGRNALAAGSPSKTLDVRAIPDAAPQPWLPLQDLSLRWTVAPRQARAGAAVTVTLEARADGATAAQLPDLQLPPVQGAQVFADPAQVDEQFVEGRPRVTVSRSFSIVPDAAGTLRVEGPQLDWWDANAGAARVASVQALDLQVAPGVPAATAPPGPAGAAPGEPGAAPTAGGWLHVPGVQDPVRPWALATVLFAFAWLATLAWGLHRRAARPIDAEAAVAVEAPAPAQAAAGTLRRALAGGDFGDIAAALCASIVPPATDLDDLCRRLADPRQREAVAALQRARWAGGDAAAAREQLRGAFRGGVGAAAPTPPRGELLPPLSP